MRHIQVLFADFENGKFDGHSCGTLFGDKFTAALPEASAISSSVVESVPK